jgi:hypothetical protein
MQTPTDKMSERDKFARGLFGGVTKADKKTAERERKRKRRAKELKRIEAEKMKPPQKAVTALRKEDNQQQKQLKKRKPVRIN